MNQTPIDLDAARCHGFDEGGGPAYPYRPTREEPAGAGYTRVTPGDVPGATLLDWFARDAMHAELSTAGMDGAAAQALCEAADAAGQSMEERVAFNAYNVADAMLRERARRMGAR